MRALSVQQPWTDAILYGHKPVENRSWPGPEWIIGQAIALHSSQRIDWYAIFPPGMRYLEVIDDDARLGAVLGTAVVVGCHHARDCRTWVGRRCMPHLLCSVWAMPGQYHWVMTDPQVIEPVPCKGALKLWRLPDDVEAAVRAQVPAGSL